MFASLGHVVKISPALADWPWGPVSRHPKSKASPIADEEMPVPEMTWLQFLNRLAYMTDDILLNMFYAHDVDLKRFESYS